MKIIGLTGPTGSGKSTFSDIAKKKGYLIINADEVSKSVTDKGKPAIGELCAVFGIGILNSDGSLNRRKLARIAFCNKKKTEQLQNVLFPFITAEITVLIEKAKEDNKSVILDAPTLFESGADKMCDKTVAVLSDIPLQKKRIIERDNLSEDDADIRLSAQKNKEFYIERCSHIIYNNSSLDELYIEAQKLLKILE